MLSTSINIPPPAFLSNSIPPFTNGIIFQIFEIYYFRVWVALVLWASTHALVLLPVLLSLVGGGGYVDPESEGGLQEDLRRRQYPALLAEEDEYDSDD